MFNSLRIILSATLAALVLGYVSDKEKQTPEAAPVAVSVAKIVRQDVPLGKEFVGQTKGAVDAEVRARVEGIVTAVHFEEGKPVKEDQLLYSIDPAEYLAKVAQVKGTLSQAETLLVKAQQDLKRVRPLVEIKALSEKDLDAAIAQEGAARGSVEAAKAALDSAQIELSYCEIKSPTDGIIGLTKAKIGEFVGKSPNPTILNTVSKLDPIHVLFSVTEKEYLYFARLKQKEIAEGRDSGKRSLELILSDGTAWPETGSVASTGREVDPQTGSLSMEAAFPNQANLLRPGQFAKIRVIAETLQNVLLVPQKAIKQLQGIDQVFVVGADNIVALKNIKTGPASEQMQVVEEGLSEGDTVVVEGIQRLKPGSKVSY